MQRRTLMLIVALLIAALGTAMIVLYVKGIDARAAEGQELVQVLTATQQIELGEGLEAAQAAGKVELRETRTLDLVAGALTEAGPYADRFAVAPIYPGQQLLGPMFGSPTVATGLGLKPGQVAISITLSDAQRVGGFVTPGSKIGLFSSTDLPAEGDTGQATPYTGLMLPSVTVLGVGATTASGKKPDAGQIAEKGEVVFTLAVDQKQAQQVIFAARNTQLTFALLGEKTRLRDGTGVKLKDVLPQAFRGSR